METDQTDDRRSILEQGFDAAEKGEPIEAVNRDEAGRFASKPAAPEPQVQQEVQQEEEPPVWSRPPASWKKEYHDVWSKADPKMREYAWQREEQMRKGVEPLLTKAQFADAMNSAIEPYRETIRGLGIPEHEAVAALMKADYTLRTTTDPAARLAYFQNLAREYGVNLGQAPQAQSTVDPMVYQLQNELNKVRGEVMGWKQQQEMAENQTLLGEIESFSQKAEYFEDARPAMIQLLQSGMAQTLDEAYDKAIRLDSSLFERVQAAKQAEAQAKQAQEANRAAKAARAAAVSVRSATPGANTAPKAANRRAMLEEALAETESRL
jgi:hypothetical protein